MKSIGGTDIGFVRKNNEDNFICAAPLFAVADGMGGHAAGEIASAILVDEVRRASLPAAGFYSEDDLRCIMEDANQKILDKAKSAAKYSGMGTTAIILAVGEQKAFWAHVGDSRLYRYRDGLLEQLTTDHSLVNIWVENGTLTPQEAKHHPKKNILVRALGTDALVEIDTGSFAVCSGDIYLLATDGLTNMVDDNGIAAVLGVDAIDDKVEKLIAMALDNGGTDNVTAIVVKIE